MRLTMLFEVPDWHTDGACAETYPDAFFPEEGPRFINQAKAVCARCGVQPECLAWALDHDEQFGIWGGLTRNERERLASKAKAPGPGQVAA